MEAIVRFTSKIILSWACNIVLIIVSVKRSMLCQNWYLYTWSKNDVISSVWKHYCALVLVLVLG